MAKCKQCGSFKFSLSAQELCKDCELRTVKATKEKDLTIRRNANERAKQINETAKSITDNIKSIITFVETGTCPSALADEGVQLMNLAVGEAKRAVSAVNEPHVEKINPIIESAHSSIDALHVKSLELLAKAVRVEATPKLTLEIVTSIDSEGKAEYEYEDVKIAVIKGQEPDFEKDVQLGRFVRFVQEPENEYDSNAIKVILDPVVYENGVKLGYLYKGKLQDMANDFLKRGDFVVGYIHDKDTSQNLILLNITFSKNTD